MEGGSGESGSNEPDRSWIVETSRDGRKWRLMGKAWTFTGEPLIVHAASRYLRYRPAEDDSEEAWVGPLERDGDACMALLDLSAGTRTEIWPSEAHLGTPVFLPGGEAGRLLRFERSADGYSWRYALEFEGETPARFRSA